MTKDEALKLALEALELNEKCSQSMDIQICADASQKTFHAITAIKEALAQPEQEHFALKHRIAELEGAVIGLQAQLAQPEQEPVATLWQHGETGRTRITMPGDITDCDARWFKAADLYTTPPQRKPLTDEELRVIENKINPNMRWRSSDEEGITLYPIEYYELVRAIEAKLKEKNT